MADAIDDVPRADEVAPPLSRRWNEHDLLIRRPTSKDGGTLSPGSGGTTPAAVLVVREHPSVVDKSGA